MIGNIKKTFPPKTGMQKKQVLQDPGYVKDVKDACCMLHALCKIMLKILKQAKTDFIEFIYFLSKMCTNYNVDSNTKSSNYSCHGVTGAKGCVKPTPQLAPSYMHPLVISQASPPLCVSYPIT